MSVALMATYSAPGIVCGAADFDGTNDYIAFPSSGGSNITTAATISFWFYSDQTQSGVILHSGNSSVGGDNRIRITAGDSTLDGDIFTTANESGSSDLIFSFRTTTTSANGWHHFLFSIDHAGSDVRHFWIDDVDASDQDTYNDGQAWNFLVDQECAVGAKVYNTLGDSKYKGGLAELWIGNVYLDLSKVHNRRKFITADGKPVHLGSDGSLPGTAPITYLHLDDSEAAANFATNSGSGQNGSITGALSTFGSSPSD